MDGLTLLRSQMEFTFQAWESAAAEITPARAAWKPAGSLANTVGATLFHITYAMDSAFSRTLNRSTIFELNDWQGRLGIDAETVWTAPSPDPTLLREYGAAVRAQTRLDVDAMQPSVLYEEIPSSRGPRQRSDWLSVMLMVHPLVHLGEISALLGCQGFKRLPV